MKKAGMGLICFSVASLFFQIIGSIVGASAAGNPNYITLEYIISNSLWFPFFFGVGLILYAAGKIARIRAIKRYANKTINAIDGSWKCPICRNQNLYTSRCDKCGFVPLRIDNQTQEEDESYKTIDL